MLGVEVSPREVRIYHQNLSAAARGHCSAEAWSLVHRTACQLSQGASPGDPAPHWGSRPGVTVQCGSKTARTCPNLSRDTAKIWASSCIYSWKVPVWGEEWGSLVLILSKVQGARNAKALVSNRKFIIQTKPKRVWEWRAPRGPQSIWSAS